MSPPSAAVAALRRPVAALAVAAAVAAALPAAALPTARRSAARLAGQSIMPGMNGTAPSSSLRARIRAGQVGGVILFGGNFDGTAALARLVSRLQAAAAAGGNPPLLIALDQEGGAVRRLPDGPPDKSATELGQDGSASEVAREGSATAAYLRRFGVDVDLAPVLDTPTSPANFIGTRVFSRDRRLNAELGAAFVRGLQRGRVAATAKHFPGLGTAPLSTDTNRVVLDTPRGALDARLAPFARAIGAGVKLVMVSNAGYRAYDRSGIPAVLSKPIVTGLLRGRLGFAGVVISDAMEAPGPSASRTAPSTAIAAGVDVLLYTSESASADGYAELVRSAGTGTLPALERSAARIAALKQWLARP